MRQSAWRDLILQPTLTTKATTHPKSRRRVIPYPLVEALTVVPLPSPSWLTAVDLGQHPHPPLHDVEVTAETREGQCGTQEPVGLSQDRRHDDVQANFASGCVCPLAINITPTDILQRSLQSSPTIWQSQTFYGLLACLAECMRWCTKTVAGSPD